VINLYKDEITEARQYLFTLGTIYRKTFMHLEKALAEHEQGI